MTTKDMKLALLRHFRWRLKYPIVATECLIGGCPADVIAVRKTITEVEVKRKLSELKQDLKKKYWKHQKYLRPSKIKSLHYLDRRPNKFYFALPIEEFPPDDQGFLVMPNIPKLPEPYGLIIVESLEKCHFVKRAKYLTRENQQVDEWKEVLMRRLTAENITLREKLREENNEES